MQADPSASSPAPTGASTYGRPTTGFDRSGSSPHVAPSAAPGLAAASAPRSSRGTGYVTGAYQPSGDHFVDRMLRLEHALKQHAPKF